MKKLKKLFSLFLISVFLISIAPSFEIRGKSAFSGSLQFHENGKFVVMQITDIQSSSAANLNSRVVNLIKNAIDRHQPDLVIFTGDNQTGGSTAYKGVIDKFLKPLLDSDTKFAVTFGNHDHEAGVSRDTQYNYYKTKGGDLFIDHDVPVLSGSGSGVIPIYPYGQNQGTPAFQLYVMDSGSYPNNNSSNGYDSPYTDQIDYYIQRSLQYPNVPSLWYMHIIVPEVYTKTMNQVSALTPNAIKGNGTPFSSYYWALDQQKIDWSKSRQTISEIYKEAPCPANWSTYTSSNHRSSSAYGNLTLYDAWVNYGNMLGTYYGHDHKNSFVTRTDDGIDIGFCKAATLQSYNDDNPGLRVFELDVEGTYTSESVTEQDLAKVRVSFDPNGGQGFMPGQYINKNSSAKLSENIFTKVGYSFDGWSTSPNGPLAYADKANISVSGSDVKLYARWKANKTSMIGFDANGGEGSVRPVAMVAGTPLYAPEVFRTGYIHTGWLPELPMVVPEEGTLFVAQWVPITYTVKYHANGGTGETQTSSHLYDEENNLTPNGFDKKGHSFVGWSYEPGGNKIFNDGESVINLSASQNGQVDLYALWSINSYQMTFDANGGVGSVSSYKEYGSELTAPEVEKLGHTFAGWQPAVPPTVPDFDETFVAQWTVNTYKATFDANGGTGSISLNFAFGAPIIPPTVQRNGYIFVRWSPELPETMPAHDINLVAIWEPDVLDAVFIVDGIEYARVPTTVGKPIVKPDPPTKTGAIFLGWNPAVPQVMPPYATTFTAKWHYPVRTISFNLSGGLGTVPPPQSGTYGTSIDLPTSEGFTRAGYSFLGWGASPNSAEPLHGYNIGLADETLYALWVADAVLLPGAGSVTLIDDSRSIILGISPGTSQEDFASQCVKIQGDAYLKITATQNGFGTGSIIQLINTADNQTIHSYTLIIFGDVNGDGIIDSADASDLVDYENFVKAEGFLSENLFRMAANLNGDDIIDSLDSSIMTDYENFLVDINPLTGEVS